tara:strand:+ start:472 stop:2103 length:1632 start_codon:yes stop_codon:yes gene_type:complete
MKNPKDYGLPYESLREGQVKAIDWIEKNDWLYSKGEDKVKVIEAPTGTGKTGLILYLAAKHPDLRILVLCATKLEQAQYEDNVTPLYKGFVSVKGRNNFHCYLDSPLADEECSDSVCFDIHVDQAKCTVFSEKKDNHFKCEIRDQCTYFQQLDKLRYSKVIVTNYAYGLAMLNFNPDRFGKFDLIVSDEGHVLDEMLESFIQVKLWHRQMEKLYGIELPEYETVAQWQRWCDDRYYAIEDLSKKTHQVHPRDMSKEEISLAKRADSVKQSFDSIKDMDVDWVVEQDRSSIEFKPVWVTSKSKQVLFNFADRHIIMSGTIPSGVELARKVGIKTKEFQFYRLPYLFPVENRPIICKPTAIMNAKSIDMNLPIILNEIDRIIGENLDKKILIHTVNYKIARFLESRSKYSGYLYTHDSRNRLRTLQQFKKATAPAILVSPSFDKAVDLPDKECELTIIAKLPYPYLGSKVMQKRLEDKTTGRRYYNHETLASLIQMAGRGVRSETDKCPTIILDSGAPKFFKQCRTQNLIPQGIEEAIEVRRKHG